MWNWLFRQVALILYVLAIRSAVKGNLKKSEKLGKGCVFFLEHTRMETLSDCATSRISLWGVLIPGLFHDDVVRFNLGYHNVYLPASA